MFPHARKAAKPPSEIDAFSFTFPVAETCRFGAFGAARFARHGGRRFFRLGRFFGLKAGFFRYRHDINLSCPPLDGKTETAIEASRQGRIFYKSYSGAAYHEEKESQSIAPCRQNAVRHAGRKNREKAPSCQDGKSRQGFNQARKKSAEKTTGPKTQIYLDGGARQKTRDVLERGRAFTKPDRGKTGS